MVGAGLIFTQVISKPKKPLRSNRRSRTVDWFRIVKWVCRFRQILARPLQVRSTAVPHRNSICATVCYIKIRCGLSRVLHRACDPLPPSEWTQLRIRDRLDKLQLLSEAASGPGQSAHPGAEWRIALLRVWTTITPIIDVEDAFVSRPPTHIIRIATLAVINPKLRRHRSVLHQSLQQRNFSVMLAHQHMPESMRQGQRSQRSHRSDEQRVGAVERVDKPAPLVQPSPARGLHRT